MGSVISRIFAKVKWICRHYCVQIVTISLSLSLAEEGKVDVSETRRTRNQNKGTRELHARISAETKEIYWQFTAVRHRHVGARLRDILFRISTRHTREEDFIFDSNLQSPNIVSIWAVFFCWQVKSHVDFAYFSWILIITTSPLFAVFSSSKI